MIKAESVKKTYQNNNMKYEVLKGISLTIKKREFTAIVGRSGSGKSTFMNLVGLLDDITSGEILVDGKNTKSLDYNQQAEFRNKMIGFIFQSFFLEPAYTVFQNIEIPLLLTKTSKSVRNEKIKKVLESVDLIEMANKKTANLSGGEKQRVCIARAIINDPPIVLADEPCGNLDVVNSNNVMKLLRSLADDGKTVLLVTHNLEDAQKTDRIITFQDGQVISDVLN